MSLAFSPRGESEAQGRHEPHFTACMLQPFCALRTHRSSNYPVPHAQQLHPPSISPTLSWASGLATEIAAPSDRGALNLRLAGTLLGGGGPPRRDCSGHARELLPAAAPLARKESGDEVSKAGKLASALLLCGSAAMRSKSSTRSRRPPSGSAQWVRKREGRFLSSTAGNGRGLVLQTCHPGHGTRDARTHGFTSGLQA